MIPETTVETRELLRQVLTRLDEIAYTQGRMTQTMTSLAGRCWYCGIRAYGPEGWQEQPDESGE